MVEFYHRIIRNADTKIVEHTESSADGSGDDFEDFSGLGSGDGVIDDYSEYEFQNNLE